ncbi:MAG: response regulator transcription factor [Candidatus Marinimicrobia bacterium]|nr:response regulator transcription factor [Candidatus Neomarinimicrobiota bacterium]
MDNKPVRVCIVDDHPIVRRGLKEIISEIPGFMIVGEVDNGKDALRFLNENDVDIVTLDISMPGQSGIDILEQIMNIYPEIKVLILSMHPEEQYALRAYRNKAAGYITKDNITEELTSALVKIAEGHRYVSRSLSEQLIGKIGDDFKQKRYEKLSNREYQILVRIASGHSLSEIAGDLSLSIQTVSTYRRRVLDKMNMKNDPELTRYAIQNDLLE